MTLQSILVQHITPNLAEFKQFSKLSDISDQNLIDEYAKKILSNHAIKNILLTRSADGMSLINETEMKQFSTKPLKFLTYPVQETQLSQHWPLV